MATDCRVVLLWEPSGCTSRITYLRKHMLKHIYSASYCTNVQLMFDL